MSGATARLSLPDEYRNRWTEVFVALGLPERAVNGRNGPCPMCEGATHWRFVNYGGNGCVICSRCYPQPVDAMTFLQDYLGANFAGVADAVRSALPSDTLPAAAPRTDDAQRRAKARERLNRIWCASAPVAAGDVVARYLESRDIDSSLVIGSDAIRLHPELPYYGEDEHGVLREQGRYPAMIAQASTPEGRAGTLHMTYLDPSGTSKAFVPTARKEREAVRDWSGGAVRIAPSPNGWYTVGEGIESTLSAAMRFGGTPWAALNANRLEQWEPPPDARIVIVAGDCDESYTGQAAAYALARRLTAMRSGLMVRVRIPELANADWNDVLDAESAT